MSDEDFPINDSSSYGYEASPVGPDSSSAGHGNPSVGCAPSCGEGEPPDDSFSAGGDGGDVAGVLLGMGLGNMMFSNSQEATPEAGKFSGSASASNDKTKAEDKENSSQTRGKGWFFIATAALISFVGYTYLYYPQKPDSREAYVLSSKRFSKIFQDIDEKTKEAQLRVSVPELNVRHGTGPWGYVNRSHIDVREKTKVVVLKYGKVESDIMIVKAEMTGAPDDKKNVYLATVPTAFLTKVIEPEEIARKFRAGTVTNSTKYAEANQEIVFHDPEQKYLMGPIIRIPEGAPIEIVKPIQGHFYREYSNGREAIEQPFEVRVPVLAGDKATKIYVVSGRDLLAIDKATFDAKSAAATKPTKAPSVKALSRNI